MLNSAFLAAATAGFLLASPAAGAIYTKNSPVLQVDAKNYDKLIAKSNYTSIVEFYAPWCGHCQNLKPAYEKAAKNLAGLAKVAAVNCDEDANKPFCGQFGVQGFPTLKIVRPGKKPGKPSVEDYQGPRSAKGIVDAVVDKIPNHVKKLTDKNFEEFWKEGNETAKAVLFTEKGTTSALLRAVAIDFLGSITVGQVRNTQKAAVEAFGVTKFPSLVLLPGGEKEGIVFDSDLKKDALVTFLSQVASPNPDPAPSDSKKSAKPSKKPSKSSKSAPPAASETLESTPDSSETTNPDIPTTDDTDPPKEAVKIEELPPMLELLEHASQLESSCLTSKSTTCILALLPEKASPSDPLSPDAQKALASLGNVQTKHQKLRTKLFPFYSVPPSNAAATALRQELKLSAADQGTVEILAINAKRNWVRRFAGTDFSQISVEDWIDAIRMGDGKKERIPEGLVVEHKVPQEEEVVINLDDLKAGTDQGPIKVSVEEIIEEGQGHDEL